MITSVQRVEAEASIASAVAACVTDIVDGEWDNREWIHLFVDMEVDDSGDRSSSVSFALARRPGQPLEKIGFRLSRTAKRLFADLANSMDASPNGRWTSVQLRIERDGRYSLHYSYAPPYRLDGKVLDTRFNDYLAHWLNSQEGAAFRPRPGAWWQRWMGQ